MVISGIDVEPDVRGYMDYQLETPYLLQSSLPTKKINALTDGHRAVKLPRLALGMECKGLEDDEYML